MPADHFDITVDHHDGAAVFELVGTINRAAKERVEAAYSEVDADRIVLDFTRVDYINSTGIAVIVGLLAMARADRREMAGHGLSEHYREIFRITRLADFITIYDDPAHAVTAGAERGDRS